MILDQWGRVLQCFYFCGKIHLIVCHSVRFVACWSSTFTVITTKLGKYLFLYVEGLLSFYQYKMLSLELFGLFFNIVTQIWPHDWQCRADCYWHPARERCSRVAGEMSPFRHVWQVPALTFCIFCTSSRSCFSPFLFSFLCFSSWFSFFSIATLAVAQNMRELYRLVLVDTPLAPYFSECLTSEVKSRRIYSCSLCLQFCAIVF